MGLFLECMQGTQPHMQARMRLRMQARMRARMQAHMRAHAGAHVGACSQMQAACGRMRTHSHLVRGEEQRERVLRVQRRHGAALDRQPRHADDDIGADEVHLLVHSNKQIVRNASHNAVVAGGVRSSKQ